MFSLDILDDLGEKVAATANAQGPGKVIYRHTDIVDRASVDAVFGEAVTTMPEFATRCAPAQNMDTPRTQA